MVPPYTGGGIEMIRLYIHRENLHVLSYVGE